MRKTQQAGVPIWAVALAVVGGCTVLVAVLAVVMALLGPRVPRPPAPRPLAVSAQVLAQSFHENAAAAAAQYAGRPLVVTGAVERVGKNGTSIGVIFQGVEPAQHPVQEWADASGLAALRPGSPVAVECRYGGQMPSGRPRLEGCRLRAP